MWIASWNWVLKISTLSSSFVCSPAWLEIDGERATTLNSCSPPDLYLRNGLVFFDSRLNGTDEVDDLSCQVCPCYLPIHVWHRNMLPTLSPPDRWAVGRVLLFESWWTSTKAHSVRQGIPIQPWWFHERMCLQHCTDACRTIPEITPDCRLTGGLEGRKYSTSVYKRQGRRCSKLSSTISYINRVKSISKQLLKINLWLIIGRTQSAGKTAVPICETQ